VLVDREQGPSDFNYRNVFSPLSVGLILFLLFINRKDMNHMTDSSTQPSKQIYEA
jgi:hypothetical protein